MPRRPHRRSRLGHTTTLAKWLPITLSDDLLIETVAPGYVLGIGTELRTAMAAGLRIAVDIAHLEI